MPKPIVIRYPQASQEERDRRYHRPTLLLIWFVVMAFVIVLLVDASRSGALLVGLVTISVAILLTVFMWRIARRMEPRPESGLDIDWSLINWKGLITGSGVLMLGILLFVFTEGITLAMIGVCLVIVGLFWAFVALHD